MVEDQLGPRRRKPARLACLLIALAAMTALIAPSIASASCGGVETKQPRRNANPGGNPPLAIGDSEMLLALSNLAHIGYLADAQGCRQFVQGLATIRGYKRKGRLGHLVVIALGADLAVSAQNVRAALHILGPKRVLGLVVPRELGGGTSSDARVVRAAYRRHPKRIVLLDWVRFSKGTPKWFQPDKLHLTYSGAAAYTKLIGKALRYAVAGILPDHAHFPR